MPSATISVICGSPTRVLVALVSLALRMAAAEPAPDRTEGLAWVDLLTDLAFVAPTTHQSDAVEAAFALHDRWLKGTNDPPTPIRSNLLGRARAIAGDLRRTLPYITIELQTGSARLLPDTSPIRLARSLPHTVLVEVIHRGPSPARIQLAGTDPAQPPFPPQRMAPGESRLFRVSLLATQSGSTNLSLSLSQFAFDATDASPPRTQMAVPVPAIVVEPARIRGIARDGDSGGITPARIRVRGADGILRHGSEFATNQTLSSKPLLNFVFAGLPKSHALPFFYTSGRFEVLVPPGETSVVLERGFEHLLVTNHLTLAPGEVRELELSSRRFLDMKAAGWISGDTHIHWARNWWSEDEDISLLRLVQRAEDLRVANNLTLKHHIGPANFIAPTQFPMGPIPGLCDGEYHAQMGEEWRNEEFYGHLVLLNIQRLIEPISTGSMGGAPHFWDWPQNLHAIRETRAQGGLVIEAHGLGRNANVPVDVALALADSLDQIEPDDYYRFLDCGFRIPLSNGSDHPARVAGCARVYVQTDAPFTYERWIDGIRRNRTFTTSGPLLFLDVNGHGIGDVLDVAPGTPLRIRARAMSRHPVGVLQVIANGRMLGQVPTRDREATLELEVKAGEPLWIVARASVTDSFNALNGPDIAHTSAVYVKVEGRSRFTETAAREWAARMRRHAEDIRRDGRFERPEQRSEAVAYVLDGVERFERMIREGGPVPER